jgi:hypothetical protein
MLENWIRRQSSVGFLRAMYFFISTSPRKIAIVMYNIVVAVIACKQQHKRGVEARRRRRDEATIGHGGGGVSGRAGAARCYLKRRTSLTVWPCAQFRCPIILLSSRSTYFKKECF